MGEGERPDSDEAPDATRVDLGDDLLEKTAVIQVSSPPAAPVSDHAHHSPPPVQITDPQDAFESARILLSEGFQDEAKHLLRRILMEDSSHAGAKAKLAEIHEAELKVLLEGRPASRPRRIGQEASEPRLRLEEIDSERIAQQLEKDLGLEERPLGLVVSAAAELGFLNGLRKTVMGISAAEKIDVGIAFLEMGLFSAAAALFSESARSAERGDEARLLLAQTQFFAGRLGEAELALDAVLSQSHATPAVALEGRYWMARILEARQRWSDAVAWYQEVARLDATYRDTLDRLRLVNLRMSGR